MAFVESLTKARMLAIEAASVISGVINGSGHLILTTFGGSEIDAGYVIASVPDASTTVKGIVELATTAEATTGTDATRAVTPAGLLSAGATHIPAASTTVQGKVELATSAETITGTDTDRAITPAGLKATASQAYFAMTGEIRMWSGITAPTGWLFCDGASVSRTTYADLFAIAAPSLGTATMTIASPGVVSLTAHGMVAGDTFFFTTTGALPTGVTENTLYYVLATSLTSGTFRFAATAGGSAINTSGSQSGTHTLRRAPYGIASSTNFNLPNTLGRTPIGVGTATANGATNHNLGQLTGEETHVLTIAEMPSHRHRPALDLTGGWSASNPQAFTRGATAWQGGTTSDRPSSAVDSTILELTGGDGAHNNMQPSVGVNFIIKT